MEESEPATAQDNSTLIVRLIPPVIGQLNDTKANQHVCFRITVGRCVFDELHTAAIFSFCSPSRLLAAELTNERFDECECFHSDASCSQIELPSS